MSNNNVVYGIMIKGDGTGLTSTAQIAQADLDKLGQTGKAAGESINAGANKGSEGVTRMVGDIERLTDRIAMMGHVGALAWVAMRAGNYAGEVIRIADEYTGLQARLRLATDSQTEFNIANKALFDISQNNRVGLSDSISLYAKLSPVMRELGMTQQQTLGMTDLMGKSLQLSGANAANSSAAMLQFSQALGSGVMRGDEFNSLMENAPRLMRALADGMNVPIGSLRAMAEQGKLTADQVTQALMSQKSVIEQEFTNLPLTVAGAWVNLGSAITQEIGKINESAGITGGLASGLNLVTDNAHALISVLGGATVAATAFSAVKLGDSAREAVLGIMAKRAALLAEQQATIASAVASTQAAAVAAGAEVARTAAVAASTEAEVVRAAATARSAASISTMTGVYSSSTAALLAHLETISVDTAAQNAHSQAVAIATAAEAANTEALAVKTAAQTAATARTGVLTGAVALLGGPLGAITLLLGVGATAWMLWGDATKTAVETAKEEMDKAIAKAKELAIAQGQVGLKGTEQDSQAVLALKDSELVLAAKREEVALVESNFRKIGEWTDYKTRALALHKQELAEYEDYVANKRAAIEKNAANEASFNHANSAAWDKLTQTKAQQREADIAALNAEYLKKIDVQRTGQEEMLKLAEQYRVGLTKIDDKYKDKKNGSNPNSGINSALEAMQMDAVKSQLMLPTAGVDAPFEASGLSASAAAEQVKVYSMALKGAHEIEKLMAENKPKEAAALRAKLDVELETAQMLADRNIALERDSEDKKKADKASHTGVQLMGKLDAESAGVQAIADANTLSDPALQGTARIEAERAIAQASEDSKYQIKAEALAREWELMANDGTLTEQNAAIQAKRMEKLEEEHQGRLRAIQLKAGADKRKNDLDIVSFTNAIKAGEYSSAMGFAMKMTAGLASHSRAAFEVNKAASISKAVMDTYKGVGGVLGEFPGPVGWAMAAVQAAMGIAQVNAINATQFGGGGSATASVGSGGGIPSLSTSVGTPVSEQPSTAAPAQAAAPREVNLIMTGGQNFYSADSIRNLLIPALNDAVGDGVTINVVTA